MKHPYLSDKKCVKRLLDEYTTHGGLVIAYDFDNCVFDYHNAGHDYSEVVDILRKCKDVGFYLIVFTAEQDTDKVKNYLNTNSIPFDSINENPPFFKSDARKIYYNLLLDDRAGLLSAYNQLEQLMYIIKPIN